MSNTKVFTKVDAKDIIAKATDLKAAGYRLAQIHAHTCNGYELTYTFDKDHEAENIRVEISEDEEIMSISGVYWPAFLYENEMKDLHGVKIRNIALDYNGHLYKVSVPTPFNPKKEKVEEEGKVEA